MIEAPTTNAQWLNAAKDLADNKTWEQLSATYISPKSSDILVYVLLLMILMVRPWGLFGQRELGRV